MAIIQKIRRHTLSALETAASLVATPIELILIVIMVGVTMSLPIALYSVFYNIEQHAGAWGARPHVTLIMQAEVNQSEIEVIEEKLRHNPLFSGTNVISPDDALARMNEIQEMNGVMEVLEGENPLPFSLVLILDHTLDDEEITLLRQNLEAINIVDEVLVDVAWLQKLNASVRIGKMVMIILAGVLCLGVLLVVGNTIRAKISQRIDEMEILTLMGATRGFVVRPYLYSGLFIGVLGALVGTVLVDVFLRFVKEPVAQLALQYHSNFEVFTLPTLQVLVIAACGGFLGWLAALLTSFKALNRLELD